MIYSFTSGAYQFSIAPSLHEAQRSLRINRTKS